MRVALSPFATDQAAEIATWPRSAAEARAWAGSETPFPMGADQFRVWHGDPDIFPFVGRHDGALVAYGELWVDRAELEVELARIIVPFARRGLGLGRAFVGALVEQAATFGLPDLFMRVVPDNRAAIRCYESAGFVRVSADDQAAFNRGSPTDYVWLKRDR